MGDLSLLPDEARERVEKVRNCHAATKDMHEAFRRKGERFHAKYRSYKELKKTHSQSEGRDVDSLLNGARAGFGEDLFIPYCFSVIETTLPRMLSTNPRMLITPGLPEWEDNVESIRLLLNRQQGKIGYPLILQDIGKDGLIYGLGVGKVFWDEKIIREQKYLQPAAVLEAGKPEYVQGTREKLVYSGPRAECIDPFEFLWDPDAHDMETMRWAIHRTWRDDQYVSDMIKAGTWELPEGVTLDLLLAGGSSEKESEIHQQRMSQSGYPDQKDQKKHEVWEFHDGLEVTTIMDQWCPVQAGANPFWHGQLPFQLFRPTKVPHELVGIGEVESIEDLQEEMNVMRTQRRNNAAIVLQRPFAYFDGLVDPANIQFGPGLAIPVDGDPRELLFPIPIQDIPNSTWQEDASLQRDIERTTGIDDTISGSEGGGGASTTATGVQLVQAAANARIANKTKRLEQETVKEQASQFLELNQQKIVTSGVIPGPPKPGEPDRRWSWYAIGPKELAGEYELEPEGGSMAPPNPVEKLDKATRILQAFQNNPLVRQDKVIEYALENFGIENPGTWIIPPGVQVPEEAINVVGEALASQGIDPAQFHELVAEAMAQVEEQQSQEMGGEQGSEQAPPGAPG